MQAAIQQPPNWQITLVISLLTALATTVVIEPTKVWVTNRLRLNSIWRMIITELTSNLLWLSSVADYGLTGERGPEYEADVRARALFALPALQTIAYDSVRATDAVIFSQLRDNLWLDAMYSKLKRLQHSNQSSSAREVADEAQAVFWGCIGKFKTSWQMRRIAYATANPSLRGKYIQPTFWNEMADQFRSIGKDLETIHKASTRSNQ
jgi:hypothetical protein